MSLIKDILIGRNGVAPIIVRLARSTLEVAVLAGLGYLVVWSSSYDWGDMPFLGAGAYWVLLQLEGIADQYIDPDQNRSRTE